MTRKKVIDIALKVLWLVVMAAMLTNNYVRYQEQNPTAGFGDYALQAAPAFAAGTVILAGLALIFWLDGRLRRIELNKREAGVPAPSGLAGMVRTYPARMVLLAGLIASTAVLVWLQSWIAAPVLAAALFVSIHVARLAGLEPDGDPSSSLPDRSR